MASVIDIKVPDIGDFKDVEVIEVLVKPGDKVEKEASLISLESDKATMEIPSSDAGVVKELKVKVGDKVNKGSVILTLEAGDAAAAEKPTPDATTTAEKTAPKNDAPPPSAKAAETASQATAEEPAPAPRAPPIPSPEPVTPGHIPHASPSVRRFARELGVDLAKVGGTGPKGRIQQEDVQNFVKNALAGDMEVPAAKSGGGLPFNLPDLPQIDFSKFGPVEAKPLSRIKKLSGANLHRNSVAIPHVTQFDEADITELEAFRKTAGAEAEKQGFKLTMLSFLIKASVTTLKAFPDFNASLDRSGENLVLKKYFHIGVAVDTPDGLVVPVIRDADKKGVFELAKELSEVSKLARDKKLKATDMQGGCFSISSLGGIGGTLFTPIINAPEVAILGVSRSAMKQVWVPGKDGGGEFRPRLMLPLSLSYDHRVVDGAAGARFITYLSSVLGDIRRTIL
jgi:pyruvate dehydrogenase E2 component (dihydrolipoamide acetyltransferase)